MMGQDSAKDSFYIRLDIENAREYLRRQHIPTNQEDLAHIQAAQEQMRGHSYNWPNSDRASRAFQGGYSFPPLADVRRRLEMVKRMEELGDKLK